MNKQTTWPRLAMAHAELRTAAVTGTNGKTTTVSMIAAVIGASGEVVSVVTTLGSWVDGEPITHRHGREEFARTVERARERGGKTLALEVVSKALSDGFAHLWPPDVAVFTNLSRDHFDVHGNAESYLAAKAQLFMALSPSGTAVLNADDPASELLVEVLPEGVAVRWFSTRGAEADLAAVAIDSRDGGTTLTLARSPLADALGGTLELGVTGAMHAGNALAAALAADTLGYAPDVIALGLAEFRGVEGRFEVVGRAPLVAVDFAHTPDALRAVLTAARALVQRDGRLVCVFGCGGDRDQGKRPEMGATVHRLADLAVLTSDNPRHEDPEAIADAIRAGVDGPGATWDVRLDRRAAIEHAVATAGPDDVVVIAGRGPETHQLVGDEKVRLADGEVAAGAHEKRRH